MFGQSKPKGIIDLSCHDRSMALAVEGSVELFSLDFVKTKKHSWGTSRRLFTTYDHSFPVDSLLSEVHFFEGNGILSSLERYNLGFAQKWHPDFFCSSGIFFVNEYAEEKGVIVLVSDGLGASSSCVVMLSVK